MCVSACVCGAALSITQSLNLLLHNLEVAEVCTFLTSDKSSYVTGSLFLMIEVSGEYSSTGCMVYYDLV